MFYRWSADHPPKTMCYILAAVPSASDLKDGNKSYLAEGDVGAIEIWNVTRHPSSFHSINWNTRPERVALLGTVNFTETVDTLDSAVETDGKELRAPTPRFDCSGEFDLAVEIACKDCLLEFEQVFSSPPLGENEVTYSSSVVADESYQDLTYSRWDNMQTNFREI